MIASEYKIDCPDCEGEGKIEHPHMPLHSLQSASPEYAVVECETCHGEGYLWTDKPCTLAEAPIGLFWHGDTLALKTEYGNNEGRIDAYIVSSGEFYWGDAPQTIASQRADMVQPIDADFAMAALAQPTIEQAVDDDREQATEVKETGQFLLDRLVDHEVRMTNEVDARERYGHVTPAMERFRAAIRSHKIGDGGR